LALLLTQLPLTAKAEAAAAREKKARVLDKVMKNMSESWSSLITGQQR
jgi:hypothetical protein